MPTDEAIHIVVAHAGAGPLFLRALSLPAGSSLAEALVASGLAIERPDLDLAHAAVGIHGRKTARDTVLRDGDRVEVYEPLRIDPMQARRLRASRQRR